MFCCLKFVSLVYVTISINMMPLVIVFISYFTIGEKFTYMDLFILLVTLVGVTLISIGFRDDHFLEDEADEQE